MFARITSLSAAVSDRIEIQHRRGEREDQPEEDLRVPGAVHLGGLVDLARDGVQVARHQPGVHPHRAAEVDQHQPPRGVQADRRQDVPDLGEHQVERDHREELREHLHQEDRHQPDPPAPEAEPREGVRGQHPEQHVQHREGAADQRRVPQPPGERVLPAAEQRGEVGERGVWRQLEGHGGQARDYLFTPELVARESTGRAPG
ncbi:hypothetical protein P3T27_001821 [Kitasatospora sp. MAA19]|uniref:hypothetical protein n=1 Tax=Kitasatospora sp. MAA19 TaxID=3035090 RepID=UPI002473D9DF|nr:hypothetical protein [Kitasatospora sp. MAA19]MDH6705113.1 hypothetical protein [Kitasatospora sp. MAA19]